MEPLPWNPKASTQQKNQVKSKHTEWERSLSITYEIENCIQNIQRIQKQESRIQITQLKMGHGSKRNYKILTLPIREIQIKTMLRFHFTPVKTSKIKKIPKNKFCCGCRQKKTPFTWVGLQTGLATTGIHAKISHRDKRR